MPWLPISNPSLIIVLCKDPSPRAHQPDRYCPNRLRLERRLTIRKVKLSHVSKFYIQTPMTSTDTRLPFPSELFKLCVAGLWPSGYQVGANSRLKASAKRFAPFLKRASQAAKGLDSVDNEVVACSLVDRVEGLQQRRWVRAGEDLCQFSIVG